jgi:ribosomal protein S3AE
MLRIAEPPGNKQLGKFAGAQSISRQFKRALVDKRRREIAGIFGLEQEDSDVRPCLPNPRRFGAR